MLGSRKSTGRIAALVLALASLAPISHAQITDAVFSANVVGVQKLSATPGLTMAATPFEEDLQDLNAVIGPQLFGSNNFNTADNILLWNPGDQQYILFFLAGDVGGGFSRKWISVNPFGIATNEIFPGEGMFIRNRQANTQTVVVAGDVFLDPTNLQAIIPGFQLLSYPYSAEIGMNSTTFTNGGLGSNNFTTADNIFLWDADDQQYQLFFLAGDVGGGFSHKWISVNPFGIATNVIQPGQAFWYRHKGIGFDWVELSPYPNL